MTPPAGNNPNAVDIYSNGEENKYHKNLTDLIGDKVLLRG